ncbi:MAG: hypothetical protein WC969_02410 [Elusimicrobiota bacterium]|jgi:hypothetical protein
MGCRLSLHGVGVLLEGDPAALEELRRDFAWFADGGDVSAPLRFMLRRALPPPPLAGALPTLRARRWAVRDAGPLREIRYPEGAVVRWDYRARSGTLWCEDPELLRELAYLAVLSRAGEELDRRGLHRVHALGFERDGDGGLLLLPSGGGKSTLALELLRGTSLNVVSEDTPLLDRRGILTAFPLRWGFGERADLRGVPEALVRPFRRRAHGLKRVVDVEFFRGRVRSGVPLRWLLVGRPVGGTLSIEKASWAEAAAALALSLVVGHGIAQMSEYVLRPSLEAARVLPSSALSRLRAALRALSHAELLRFSPGKDPAAAARLLAALQ